MAKTARVSLQLARKFVPVDDLPKVDQLLQSRTRETMILSGYTLCEVNNRNRQDLPVLNRPISDPTKSIRSVIRRLDHFYDLLT